MKPTKLSIAMFVLLLSAMVFTSTALNAAPVKEPTEPPLEKEHKFEPFDRRKIKKEKPAYSNSDDIKMSKNGRVISTGTEIVFLDDMGNISKRKPIKNGMITVFSPDGTRMSQNINTVISEKGVEKSLFKMLDENGDLLFEKENFATADMYFLSQAKNGVVVVAACGEGGCGRDFAFYDLSTNISKVVSPEVDASSEAGQFTMSDDGNYFAAGYYGNDPSVAYFDISGKQLWVKHLEKDKKLAGPIGVSPNGNYVIVISGTGERGTTYINAYNKQGVLLFRDEGGCPRCKYGFDRNEAYVLLLTPMGGMLYDLKNLKYITDISNDLPNKMFFSNVDVSSGFVAIGARYKDDKVAKPSDMTKYLYLYNITGDLLYKKKIVGHGFQKSQNAPHVKIIDNGKRVAIKLGDKVQIYKNEFAK